MPTALKKPLPPRPHRFPTPLPFFEFPLVIFARVQAARVQGFGPARAVLIIGGLNADGVYGVVLSCDATLHRRQSTVSCRNMYFAASLSYWFEQR